jgi:SAM-dependent methyltransferase
MLAFVSAAVANGARSAVLDVGAALGVATLPLLGTGAEVIANDIEPEHLQHITDRAREEGTGHRLKTILGRFPYIPEMQDLIAVHCSNVLHFLTGVELTDAFAYTQRALRPGGRLFIQVGSPYVGHLNAFRQTYEQRVKEGIRWPGEIENAREIVPESVRRETPGFLHALSAEILTRGLKEAGFSICFSDYYTRPGLPEVCKNDGRENAGVIAAKL